MMATLCVASSLALVALYGSDLTGGFCLRTQSVAGPSTIMGPILDTVDVSRDVEGVSCEELAWLVNSFLLRLFTALARSCRFASSVVTPQACNASSRSCVQPMSSRTISHHVPTSLPTAKRKER
jgi:hypothetical protein